MNGLGLSPASPLRELAEGQGVYLTGEDNLRLTTIGALAGAVVAIEGRLIQPDGKVIAFAERHVPSSVYASVATVHGLGEGLLTHVQVRLSTGTGTAGHVFGVLEIVRGLTGAVQPLATLLQGYISTTPRLAWPGSLISSSLGPTGRPRTISGTDPAAGVEISETVPAGARWRIGAINIGFQADGTVISRTPLLTIDDGATIFWQGASGVAVTAGVLAIYRFGVGAQGAVIAATHYNLALPSNLILAPGSRIRTVTANLQAGDNYTAPVLHLEEFIDS